MKRIVLTIFWFTSFEENKMMAQTWSTPGSGVGTNYYGAAYSSVTYNGELYAGGYFTTAGGSNANNIARWNGTSWSPVSNGLNGGVHSLCVYNGELYAGGSFTSAGNIAAKDIAKWNGTVWTNAGYLESYSINALAIYNGELYAAGFFIFPNFPEGVTIAKWNGINWSAVGPETPSYSFSIECMEVYNGELYAAGAYYLIGGGGVAEYYRILKWDGFNWSEVLTIPASYTLDGALGAIMAMKVYNDELYIAGQFSGFDTIWASQIAKWNGNNWSAVGSGINFESFPYGIDGSFYTFVRSLQVYNGALYATGFFNHCDTISTRNIAKWDGSNWSKLGLGLNGYGYTMTGNDTALFVGGAFNYVNGYDGIPANNIAAWKEPCSSAPLQPLFIHGNDTVCRTTYQTYLVNETPGSTNYTWVLPSGWTGYSTTNSITAFVGNSGGTITVTANNPCGSSITQTLIVTVNVSSPPVIQSNITGTSTPCIGSTETYSIASIPGVSNYTWDLPFGWIGSSTDTSITVITGDLSGVISVRAGNECGGGIPKLLPVTVATTPSQPDLIQGSKNVCIGTENLYYVQWTQPATNYSWMLPQGWTGSSITDSIVVTAGRTHGLITLNAYNNCGSSDYTTLQVSVDSIPAEPGEIVGNRYTNTNEFNYYSIAPVANAISYNWTSAGATIQGQNSPSISARWKNAGTYELSVEAHGKCGVSDSRKLNITVSDFDGNDPFNLQVFPNPSNGEFYITARRIQNKSVNVKILTSSGQIVYDSGSRIGSNIFNQFIDLKKFAQGIYIMKIYVDDKVFAKRILKIQ